jgi:FlaA1/EpsC-like NDP-sugar epimerase
VGPECEHEVVGIRPGEKIHEEMITSSDSFNTVDLGNYFAILPSAGAYSVESYCERFGAKPIPKGFAYDSGNNDTFLSVEEIKSLIRSHIDPAFGA